MRKNGQNNAFGSVDGITWHGWLALYERLEEAWSAGRVVRLGDLARWSGMSVAYVRKRRWLHQIAMLYPEKWDLTTDPDYHGNGPRPWVLVPATYEI